VTVDAGGAVFIDRDGAVFEDVLNWLQTSKLWHSQRLDETEKRWLSRLRCEADFFAVDALCEAIDAALDQSVVEPSMVEQKVVTVYLENDKLLLQSQRQQREEEHRQHEEHDMRTQLRHALFPFGPKQRIQQREEEQQQIKQEMEEEQRKRMQRMFPDYLENVPEEMRQITRHLSEGWRIAHVATCHMEKDVRERERESGKFKVVERESGKFKVVPGALLLTFVLERASKVKNVPKQNKKRAPDA